MKLFVPLFLGFLTVFGDDAPLQQLIKANNLFTPVVYKQILNKEQGNFLVSPFSAEVVLAFTQSGCKDDTAGEIRRTLRLPDNNDDVVAGVRSLLTNLRNKDSYKLHTVNKMYVKENFTVNEKFKETAIEIYGANLENINFVKNFEAAKIMNSWIEQQTNNKIVNLIDPLLLDDSTRLVLVNALYFQANWSNSFLLAYTLKSKFYKTANEIAEVDTMFNQGGLYNYYECAKLKSQILEIPFIGNDASMVIVLPNDKAGLGGLEQQIENVFKPYNFTKEVVKVALPRFKVESKFDFKEILLNLGVHKAFSSGEADLSGIAGRKGDLVVDQVVQKAFIDVNEEGVEAAAATFVLITERSGVIAALQKEFRADHPFIFYIKVKDVILFAGRVTSPSPVQ